ncbi:hypothetical protein MKW92_044738 [Papaver armeniacum]|nr:hypothetical protein MKW92_044738 [Papaver armeniacum]
MMELNLSATANISAIRCFLHIKRDQAKQISLCSFPNVQPRKAFKFVCVAAKKRQGFGPEPTEKEKTNKGKAPRENTTLGSRSRIPMSNSPGIPVNEIPGVSSPGGKSTSKIVLDREFEQRLEAVRRSALKQKNIEKSIEYGAIDYDAPIEPAKDKVGLGTTVGVGVAVVVFGLVFALGDFLPSVSSSPKEEAAVFGSKLTGEQKAALQTRLQEYEAILTSSPKDPTALEGAAVTLSELGDFNRAASFLGSLAKEKPDDPDVYRLLGEVKYELGDYEGSAAAYRSSASVSKTLDFEILRGLTNTLLAAKKPDEAVQVLLAARENLNSGNSNGFDAQTVVRGNLEQEIMKVDPIQVELLLGKAYSDWGHVSDAVTVYDQLISAHPDDFRGYLAKGIILKQNGKVGDAERMFIQARFFAPEKAKAFVDRYSR